MVEAYYLRIEPDDKELTKDTVVQCGTQLQPFQLLNVTLWYT